jgi:ATP-binding cassette, subfamily B (MDR/TAP), member 1
MAVFWACLIATSNLQMCIPRWIVYSKGKFAFADMISLIHPTNNPSNDSPLSPTFKRSRVLRKISPSRCIGELALHNVSFSYNPDSTPTLHSLSLFLPANELTFLIGSPVPVNPPSPIAQLLLGFQSPQPGNGHVTIDEQDLRFLDDAWIRENVMLIGQGIGAGGAGGGNGDPSEENTGSAAASYGSCILFPQKSIFDNIALALSSDPEGYCECQGGQ